MSVTVTLVVPCYQEEAALDAFAAALPALAADRILFVDDGSTDGTAGRLRALAAGDARVRVATHTVNRGVGAAMRTGLALAEGDVVVVYDADRTYPAEDIPRLVAALGAADVATASPWAAGGGEQDVPLHRRVLSKGAAWAYRLVLGPRAGEIATFTCAFRAYRRPVAERLAFGCDGFGAAAEMLGLALLDGARVAEVPSRLRARTEGESKMRVGRALREHLGVLGRLARARAAGTRRGRRSPVE